MKFDNDDIVYINSIRTMEEARAYIAFLESELRRHQKDIKFTEDKIEAIRKRFSL